MDGSGWMEEEEEEVKIIIEEDINARKREGRI